MPKFKPKYQEIIAQDVKGLGWVIEMPNGGTVNHYGSFLQLWEEIPTDRDEEIELQENQLRALLMAVEKKYPGESRFESALRLIRCTQIPLGQFKRRKYDD